MNDRQQLETGMSHHQAGRLSEAETCYKQVLAQDPNHVDALHLLGVIEIQNGRTDAAAELIRKALAQNPDFGEAHANLASALAKGNRFAEAIVSFRKAIELKPGNADLHRNLANALKHNGQPAEAAAEYREAIRLRPNSPETLHSLGLMLSQLGQTGEAAKAYARAVYLRPDFPEVYYHLGNALKDLGKFDQAIAAYMQAIHQKPDLGKAYGNLGSALKSMGRPEDAITFHRKALQIDSSDATTHSSLLFTLNCLASQDARTIFEEHKKWGNQHARPAAGATRHLGNDPSPDRKLRVGYVSTDFRRHSVAYFILPLLEHHDKRNVEVYCYADVGKPDEITKRIESMCHGWRNIFGLTDAAVAEKIGIDQIDILVDLSGHSAGNRLQMFAGKPAPVQITYLGYPNTTGVAAIDYRLTDAIADPPGITDEFNTEKLWRLPGCAWCYQPGDEAPDVRPRSPGLITFGCFNALAKINAELVSMWAEVLKKTVNSRLILKSAGAGEASGRERLLAMFKEHGVAPERIEIAGWIADPRAHLEAYHRVDVALDTFPYHGTTTTCEALWMGVPVVTLAGKSHVSRVGVSLLNAVSLPKLIGQTREEYVLIAAELAANPSALAELRTTLRSRMKESVLMDAPRFAREVEAAYREMWRSWRRGGEKIS